jgi:transcriptional regulator with XRE-family HTH domain
MLSNLVGTMRARRVRGWQVAEATGVGESQLSRAVNGHEQLGPIQRQRIAEYLRADVGWLFSREFKVPPLGKVAAAVSVGVGGG